MTIDEIRDFATSNLLRNTVLPSIQSTSAVGEAYINLINERDWQFAIGGATIAKTNTGYPLPSDYSYFISGIADNDSTRVIRVPTKEQLPLYSDPLNRENYYTYLEHIGTNLVYRYEYEPDEIAISYKRLAESLQSGTQEPQLLPPQFHHILSYDFAIDALRAEQPSGIEQGSLALIERKRLKIYTDLVSYDNSLVQQ